jgi:hypothetical protein
MFNKIGAWWRWNGRYMHNEFARGVKNLWRWFPTIWKDRDWDGHYIYELLRKKIEFQAEYIDSRDFHTEAKRDAERMRLVARLIKLQQDETYGMEYMDYYEQDMDWIDNDNHLGYVETMLDEKSERFDEFFAKYPRQYKRVISGEINRFDRKLIFNIEDKQLIAMEIAHENQARCQRLIFNIMHAHIERWWD